MRTSTVWKRCYSYAQSLAYLGIKRRAFDKHIKPLLPAPTPLGTSKIWDRLDLDQALADYRAQRNGRPGEKGEVEEWAERKSRASMPEKQAAGTSIRSS